MFSYPHSSEPYRKKLSIDLSTRLIWRWIARLKYLGVVHRHCGQLTHAIFRHYKSFATGENNPQVVTFYNTVYAIYILPLGNTTILFWVTAYSQTISIVNRIIKHIKWFLYNLQNQRTILCHRHIKVETFSS